MVVDASVWISMLNAEERFYDESWHWFDQQLRLGQPLMAPILLLIELAGAVARRSGVPADGHDAIGWLRQTGGLRLFPLDEGRSEMAARLAADLRLRGADATYVAIAQEVQVPLVTWDQEIVDRAAGVVPVFTPATAPR